MKKLLTVASLAVLATTVATSAFASYTPDQGIFGGRGSPDGAIVINKETTSQFSPIRGESVVERPRPDFDQTPIGIGSFDFFPTMTLGGYYDSNIYASSTNEQEDFIYKVNPSAVLQSNWGRHAVAVSAVGDFNFYNDNSDEDNNNGAIQAEGRYDIARNTWLAADVGYQLATEPRSNPSNPGSVAEPVQFGLTTMGVGAYRGAGLLSARVDYDLKAYDYEDPNLTAGGKLDLVNRDRSQHLMGGELGYEVSGNFKPFIRAAYDVRDYDRNPTRDSEGYNIVVGSKSDFGGIVTAEAYIGYLQHDYDGFTGGDISTADFGANVTWNITTLTSIEAEVDRSVEETTVGGITATTASSGILATGGSLTITHELMRDILIEAHTDYTSNEYQKFGGREDEIFGAGFGGRYFVNRNFFVDATYDFSQRDSNTAAVDYDKNIVFARVGAQY